MKFTVKSLSEAQIAMLKKTNDIEVSLTIQYMDFLVSAVKTHGVAELIGRERLSLSGDVTKVIFKAKVSLGYPNTDTAYNALRTFCSPIWKYFVAPCIKETDEGYEYDAEKLIQFQADVKSGKRSIAKSKKANGGSVNGHTGNGGNQSIEDRMAEFFKFIDKLTTAKKQSVLVKMTAEIKSRS
jgi:hypothetical protein